MQECNKCKCNFGNPYVENDECPLSECDGVLKSTIKPKFTDEQKEEIQHYQGYSEHKKKLPNYGKELILDLHECNPKKFTRYYINKFFKALCIAINMEACKVSWWDYKGYLEEYKNAPPHLKGTSAIQFISTSNITIHSLDEMRRVYLNIFSCKTFDSDIAAEFCRNYFNGKIVNKITVDRI